MDLLGWLPLAAAVFAIPQFLPQLVAVWRTGDITGVSWSWAALTSISNSAWIVYFAASSLWTALVPAIAATVLAGILAVLIARHAPVKRSAAAIAGGWTALLTLTWFVGGPIGLGTALTASFVLQVAPSVWAAYRTSRPTGISRGTWLLILGELFCWGVFGWHIADPRLTVLGWTGVVASLLVLARIPRRRTPTPGRRRASRRLSSSACSRPSAAVVGGPWRETAACPSPAAADAGTAGIRRRGRCR